MCISTRPGFALETYDPIGNWRTFYRVTVRADRKTEQLKGLGSKPVYRGLDVETGGVTPDGRDFKDIDDYKRILPRGQRPDRPEPGAKAADLFDGASRFNFADREVVEQIVAAVAAEELRAAEFDSRGGGESGVFEQIGVGKKSEVRMKK